MPTVEIGVKFDQGKLRPSLLPIEPLKEVIKVLMFGAEKYREFNWQVVPDAKKRYKDAAMRHLMDYINGERNDQESKLSHLAHCICCCLFIIWFDIREDDTEVKTSVIANTLTTTVVVAPKRGRPRSK